jgi:hypothetical protein
MVALTIVTTTTTALGTSTGTIQLRKEMKDKNDNEEGDEEPGKLLPLTLPTTVSVWQRFSDKTLGISFNYPNFPVRSQVVAVDVASGNAPVIDVQLFSDVQHGFVSVFGIAITENATQMSLPEWFHQNVDPDNILSADGTFQTRQLDNGMQALVLNGVLPLEFLDQGGPVEDVYTISPSGSKIITISSAQEYKLTDFGYSEQSTKALFVNLLGTAQFF